ncbi:MAG: hypothetical protein HKN94_03545 [Acidimicrobiales bacterium]|nr:hypothetical protein [Acidimicrobiales bacterium]
MQFTNRRRVATALLAVSLLAAACGGSDSTDASDSPDLTADAVATTVAVETTAPEAGDEATTTTEAPSSMFEGELVGLFEIAAADCGAADAVSGSTFRMAQIGATLESGPFIPNADSPCGDLTVTPLIPGTDGGLLTGSYQVPPDPAFDSQGSGLANGIAEPVTFFGLSFAMATTDEATPPAITASDGVLTGDLSAVVAYYAGLTFNQGAPKPDGATPGLTFEAPIGTIDPDTGAYVLDWASQIVGGPFDNFTGIWHLEGTFVPS